MHEVGDPALPLTAVRESIEIVRPILAVEGLDYEGKVFTARVPPMSSDAEAPRSRVPIYIAGTGPKMQQLACEIADGLLTASITTPGFVRYARRNVAAGADRVGRSGEDVDVGCTIVASIDNDRDRGRDGAREIAGAGELADGVLGYIRVLVMVVFGGLGTLLGPVLGATVFSVIDEVLIGFGRLRQVVYGLVVLVFFIGFRHGLVPAIETLFRTITTRMRTRMGTKGDRAPS